MIKTSSIILAAPPEESAAGYGCRTAHLAYRIDALGRLVRTSAPEAKKDDLLAISHSGSDVPEIDRAAFLQQAVRECGVRQYSGVICDFEGERSPALSALCGFLGKELSARGKSFAVPENYSGDVGGETGIIISSAISGGSLRRRLSEAAKRYSAERIILECERNCEDFTLPAANGSGARVSLAELDKMFLRFLPTPYFSNDLCTYYFTYRDGDDKSHFVLFDNAGSLRKKLAVAEELGITQAIFVFPEIKDIIRDILY